MRHEAAGELCLSLCGLQFRLSRLALGHAGARISEWSTKTTSANVSLSMLSSAQLSG